MTTYYVRKSGSDSYDTTQAQNPATPWLTIDKAANNVAAGDTVYVGAGVYRELVTIDTSGSSGSEIEWRADVTGENTGDPGLVIVSAYDSETGTAARACCIDLNDGKTFNEFYGFIFTGGTVATIYDGTTTNNSYEGILFSDCVIQGGQSDNDYSISIDQNASTTPSTNGLRLYRCIVNGGARIQWNGNESADVDAKITFESCLFGPDCVAATTSTALWWDLNSAGTYAVGGVTINNCTINTYYGVYIDDGTSTTYPIKVYNSLFFRCRYGMYKLSSLDGALTGDYNYFWACNSEYTNVTPGSNDKDDTDLGPGLIAGIHDLPLYRYFGWSPYRHWEPIELLDGTYKCNLVGAGSSTYAPAYDLYNEARPMGMADAADDVGAVEARARPEKETTTVRTGSNAMRFEGAGYHDIILPVDASSTTVTVYGRYDSTYSGTLPQLKILNIPGVADQTDTMTGAADNWEELSCNFTPTSAGVVRVRLVSSDTTSGGKCFFDDMAVS